MALIEVRVAKSARFHEDSTVRVQILADIAAWMISNLRWARRQAPVDTAIHGEYTWFETTLFVYRRTTSR